MEGDQPSATDHERTPLLFHAAEREGRARNRSARSPPSISPSTSFVAEALQDDDEPHLEAERLPYNEYTTVDWRRDLVKDSRRRRALHAKRGLRHSILNTFDAATGWVAAALIGTLTACVAFVVDVAVVTVSDWKEGHCRPNVFLNKEQCCKRGKLLSVLPSSLATDWPCEDWIVWSSGYVSSYAIYVGLALAYGLISATATAALTKHELPVVDGGEDEVKRSNGGDYDGLAKGKRPVGKTMYMASGSGIPEIKTVLSGFDIPHFLDLKVLLVKAFGAVFAVPTGMCLGKEGPFVHISTCVGYLVGMRFPKYRYNGRKMRELLSAACASGLSVAFGAPIGGVLFSYEEISTHFPRKVLWRAFLCSLFAAIVLKELNPTGTGKLVLFETNYGSGYRPLHYTIFVFLGICGGIFGGVFCKANFHWSKWFRAFPVIKRYPVFEVFLVTFVTAALQFPNPLTRELGDVIIRNLLINCENDGTSNSFVCRSEAGLESKGLYAIWLIYGMLVKLLLTTITFGCKVPSGVIIPALDGGAFFGRLVGQAITDMPPGIFAMVGAGAFLAGVSRMTISFVVIMFELTGELEYVMPNMVAIMVAKWTADRIFPKGVYELAQTLAGHPFLDHEEAIKMIQAQTTQFLVDDLIPSKRTMDEITVYVQRSNTVPQKLLDVKLAQLRRRGLMDGGLVIVNESHIPQGYISQSDLESGLDETGCLHNSDMQVRLLGSPERTPEGRIADPELDMSMYVDLTFPVISAKAPLEDAIEMMGKLGLEYLCVIDGGSRTLAGVILKKKLLKFLEGLGH